MPASLSTYHYLAQPNRNDDGYADVPGFCKSAPLDEVRRHGHVLTPGRYVGAEPQEDDGEPFEDKMKRLVVQLREQQAESCDGWMPLSPPISRSLGMEGEWTRDNLWRAVC